MLTARIAGRHCASRLTLKCSFQLLAEGRSVDSSVPQFTIGFKNGFLPRQDPLVKLPEKFKALEMLLQEMPLVKVNGKPGLLASGSLGDVIKSLPEYDVSNVTDSQLASALFRDYTFLASAYLLEPCDIAYKKTGDYGLGRQTLPRNIAVPLTKIAEKLNAKPFMEYALSYALYNYQKIKPSNSIEYDNLKLVRSFAGSPSEHGFILVHVAMVAHSGEQVRHTVNVMNSVEKNDRSQLDHSLTALRSILMKINSTMDTMWGRSYHADYNDFRTFIMGIKNQPMFPNGVLYEGVSKTPLAFRGESGANDTMIPTADNLLELTAKMPKNPLTDILKDFRQYRPQHHAEWLQYVEQRAATVGVRKFALGDANSAALYLANLDQVREFRMRHWNFTKEYILKHSSHPVATGGSPIVTWLPNQLATVLRAMEEVASSISPTALTFDNAKLYQFVVQRFNAQLSILTREVDALKKKYPNQDFDEHNKELKI